MHLGIIRRINVTTLLWSCLFWLLAQLLLLLFVHQARYPSYFGRLPGIASWASLWICVRLPHSPRFRSAAYSSTVWMCMTIGNFDCWSLPVVAHFAGCCTMVHNKEVWQFRVEWEILVSCSDGSRIDTWLRLFDEPHDERHWETLPHLSMMHTCESWQIKDHLHLCCRCPHTPKLGITSSYPYGQTRASRCPTDFPFNGGPVTGLFYTNFPPYIPASLKFRIEMNAGGCNAEEKGLHCVWKACVGARRDSLRSLFCRVIGNISDSSNASIAITFVKQVICGRYW